MAGRQNRQLAGILLAAATLHAAPATSQAQDARADAEAAEAVQNTQVEQAETEVFEWSGMTLEAFAALVGAQAPRPKARPKNFEETLTWLPRPRPRPFAWGGVEEVALVEVAGETVPPETTEVDAADLPADAPSEGVDLAVVDTPAEAASAASPEVTITSAPVVLAAADPAAEAPASRDTAPQTAEATPPEAEAQPEAQTAEIAPVAEAEAPQVAASQPATEPAAAPEVEAPQPVATAVAEAPASPFAPSPLASAPTALEIALPKIKTADFKTGAFQDDRRTLAQRYSETQDLEKADAALETARLFLSQMLLPEALDFIDRARQLGSLIDPQLNAKEQTLRLMHSVLADQKWPDVVVSNWDEISLWAIAGHAPKEKVVQEVNLLDAVSQLQNHSEPVISRLLPELFDAALRRSELRVADGLLRGARDATTLPREPVFQLMQGRLALAYDLPQQAFDHFAKAAAGRDIHAQRARIAMADLALARKDTKLLPDLRDILREGVNTWRHGREALIMRARLAQVAEDLGDIPLALDIMGKIRMDHPGTAEAILAHERGALAMAAFAMAVDKGEIDLSSYLITLREVEPFYRLDPIWPIARSALARAWTKAGLHDAAAAEYAALALDLERLGAPPAPALEAAKIPLSEAEAWLMNNEIGRARLALARDGLPRFEELHERYNLASLQAQVKGALSQPPTYADTSGVVRFAREARLAGLPEQAIAAHQELARRDMLAQSPAEALHAMRLAHEANDKDFAQQIFAKFGSTEAGANSAVTPALEAGLSTPMPSMLPLSQDLAAEMLARTEAALAATRDLVARPNRVDADLTASADGAAQSTSTP